MVRRKELKSEDIMSTALVTVRPEDPLHEARAKMETAEIRHLPVVDNKQRVVGMLSNRDLLRTIGSGTGRERPWVVADIMTRRVRTVRPESPAYEAASLLIKDKIGSIAVVSDTDELVGIITETDFLVIAKDALAKGRADVDWSTPDL